MQESKGGETWRPFVKTKASRTIFNVGTRTRVFIPSLPPLRSVLRSRNTSRVYRPAPIPSSSPVGKNRGNAKMPPAMRPRSRIYGRRIRTNNFSDFENAFSVQPIDRSRDEKSGQLIKISPLIPILPRSLRISKHGGNAYARIC